MEGKMATREMEKMVEHEEKMVNVEKAGWMTIVEEIFRSQEEKEEGRIQRRKRMKDKRKNLDMFLKHQ